MATKNLSLQNFYQDSLKDILNADDTIIYLNSVPTVSEGFLVISPDDPLKKEIIYYTSTNSGAGTVTCPSVILGRGIGGTTAISHVSGEPVKMNITAEYWKELQTRISKAEQGIRFHYRCNSGTGARSNCTSTAWVETPGWNNNVFTPAADGVVMGSLVMMGIQNTGSTLHIALAINGVSQQTTFGMMYITGNTGWHTQTIPFCFDVVAGTSYELTSIWQVSGNNGDICNSNTDQQFPTEIIGIFMPRTT
jgi:hypothetical protein